MGFGGAPGVGAGLAGTREIVGFAGAAAGAASPGPKTRRFTFSTTTALLRPCEKLCRTVPCSIGRFKCNVDFGGAPADSAATFGGPDELADRPSD